MTVYNSNTYSTDNNTTKYIRFFFNDREKNDIRRPLHKEVRHEVSFFLTNHVEGTFEMGSKLKMKKTSTVAAKVTLENMV